MSIKISDDAREFIDTHLDYFINTKFEVEIRDKPSAEFMAQNKDIYPASLLYVWENIGFASFETGGFWLVDPDNYQDLLDLCLEDTKFPEHDDFIVIGRNAFGEIFAIGKQTGSTLSIDMPYLRIFPYIKDKRSLSEEDFANFLINYIWTRAKKRSFDMRDGNLEWLFDRCLANHGKLGKDEIYAFMPPLVLGGANDFNHIQKVNIHEYLNFIAQLDRFTIMADINRVVDNLGITPDTPTEDKPQSEKTKATQRTYDADNILQEKEAAQIEGYYKDPMTRKVIYLKAGDIPPSYPLDSNGNRSQVYIWYKLTDYGISQTPEEILKKAKGS